MGTMRIGKKAAVSELIGAMMALVIVLALFSIVYAYYSSTVQNQTINVIQEYRSGAIKEGQLVSLVYHWESSNSSTIKVGLYDYGFYNITLDWVFINGTQQFVFSLTDANGNSEQCNCLIPGNVEVLTVSGVSGNAQDAVQNGNYELFLYATDNLAYVWEL